MRTPSLHHFGTEDAYIPMDTVERKKSAVAAIERFVFAVQEWGEFVQHVQRADESRLQDPPDSFLLIHHVLKTLSDAAKTEGYPR